MSAQPSFISIPKNPATSFANADASNFKTIMSAGSLGSRLDSLFVSNSDTTNAYVLQLAIQKSSVNYIIGEISIPIGAGTNSSTKSVAALNTVDIPGLAFTESGALYLESGALLVGKVKSTVAGANTVQVIGVGGDY